MDGGGRISSGMKSRATQEQLPSLHAVNEHFYGKFNDAKASEIIFQSFPRFFVNFDSPVNCSLSTVLEKPVRKA
jgi:hypothetical protein